MISKIVLFVLIFIVMIGFNLFIRIKTLNYYKNLVAKRIQFDFWDLLSLDRWQIVKSNYPDHHSLLDQFRTHILFTGSLFIVVVLFVVSMLYFIRFY
ncbi:MAG TPA: hypothetical protein PK006_11915 [Saprospiraceae bacterium]|nr:hypothetical protein [Saprospiraceae bacterium]